MGFVDVIPKTSTRKFYNPFLR